MCVCVVCVCVCVCVCGVCVCVCVCVPSEPSFSVITISFCMFSAAWQVPSTSSSMPETRVSMSVENRCLRALLSATGSNTHNVQ